MQEVVPGALGTLIFDENNNLVAYSGIGIERIADILEISRMQFDSSGFAVFENGNIACNVYKKDGKTVAVYTSN